MLHNQCRSWPFPLSAAIYVPQLAPGTTLPPELAQLNITTSLEEAQQRLADLHSLSHQDGESRIPSSWGIRWGIQGAVMNPQWNPQLLG